jgi:hypothetical protein
MNSGLLQHLLYRLEEYGAPCVPRILDKLVRRMRIAEVPGS